MNIVTRNKKFMASDELGSLVRAILNANFTSDYKGVGLYTIIGYFYDDDGKIVHCGKPIPFDMREFNRDEITVVMLDPQYSSGRRSRVLDYTPPKNVSAAAQQTLKRTFDEYNVEHSFFTLPSSSEE